MPVKEFDKVFIVYGESGEPYEGYVHSINKKHVSIHEHVTDTYRTLLRENIKEITVI